MDADLIRCARLRCGMRKCDGRPARGPFTALLASRGGSRELGLLAIAQMAPLGIQVGLALLTAFVLVPEERGSAVFVVSAGATGAGLLFGSFHVGAVAALESGDKAGFRRVCVCVFGLGVVFGVAALAIHVHHLSGPGLYSTENLIPVCAGLSLNILLLNISRTIQGIGAPGRYSLVTVVFAGVYASCVLVAFGKMGVRDASAVTVSWLIATAVALVVASSVLTHSCISNRKPASNFPRTSGPSVRISISAHFSSFGQQLTYRLDLLLLGIFSTAATVGVYSLAVSLAQIVWIVPEIIALSVFADIEIRRGQWHASLVRRLRALLLVSFVTAIAIVAASTVLLLIMLPDYGESLGMLLLLMPGVVLASGARVILSALIARGLRSVLLQASIGNIALSMMYLPAIVLFDAWGAAICSVIVYIGQMWFMYRLFARAP